MPKSRIKDRKLNPRCFQSASITYGVKEGRLHYRSEDRRTYSYVQLIRSKYGAEAMLLEGCLGPDVTLVPIPRSAKSPDGNKEVFWPALKLCNHLVSEGLGKDVRQLVKRAVKIKKSAFCSPDERPDPDAHAKSMTLDLGAVGFIPPERITLVDDVVTRGSTLIGATILLRQSYPDLDISSFAWSRTTSGISTDAELLEASGPKVETIEYVDGELRRF